MTSRKLYRTLAIFHATLFLAATSLAAPRERVLHGFLDAPAAFPNGRLVSDPGGNLYGVTLGGGPHAAGTVYELSPLSGGGWAYRVLHVFRIKDGLYPFGKLLLDTAGSLYGATSQGGANNCGVVFELTPASGGQWTETTLHEFTGADGCYSYGGLAIDAQGNLYGSTSSGGTTGSGVAFTLMPFSHGQWSYDVLHNFADAEGIPETSVVFDAAGNLYGGTTLEIFALTPKPGGGWTESTAYTFNPQTDGNSPTGDLVFDASGNIYGATSSGGARSWGTTFELTPVQGGGWTSTVLHSFPANSHDPWPSEGGVVLDSAGNVYGTAQNGGPHGYGGVFKLTPGTNGTWTESMLHGFTGGRDGAGPEAGLAVDASGNLYGTAAEGGSGYGVVFKIIP